MLKRHFKYMRDNLNYAWTIVKFTKINGYPIISIFFAYVIIFILNCVVWGGVFHFWLDVAGYHVKGIPWFVGGFVTFVPKMTKITIPVGVITFIIFILMKSVGA